MRIDPQEHRDRLQRLRRTGMLPPASVWLPYLALTGGREPDAVLVERRDDEGRVTVVLHAVGGGRLLRVMATGQGRWDDPLGGQDPSSVVTESWSLAGAKLSVAEAWTSRVETGFLYRPELTLDCGGESVVVPYFGVAEPAAESAALDELTRALVAALGPLRPS